MRCVRMFLSTNAAVMYKPDISIIPFINTYMTTNRYDKGHKVLKSLQWRTKLRFKEISHRKTKTITKNYILLSEQFPLIE